MALANPVRVDVGLNVQARDHDHSIVLSGDMQGTREQAAALDDELRRVAKWGGAWVVDADSVRLSPEGATMWIHGVRDRLHDCVLTYRPSHLAVVLQYDPRYEHTQSTFVDDASQVAR